MEEKTQNKREYDHLQSYCIKFESNDSEVSDGSYQSSLSSNEENDFDNIEYFREEMARFFINYPELMNNDLLEHRLSTDEDDDHWSGLASHIFQQAKQTEVSLQTIAKRIAYYRKKAQEIDLIDFIAKEKESILKQLDQEASADLNENMPINKVQHEKRSSSLGAESTENVYLSWKKRNERYMLDKSQKKSQRKLSRQNFINASKQNYKQKELQHKIKINSLYHNPAQRISQNQNLQNKKANNSMKNSIRSIFKETSKQNPPDLNATPHNKNNPHCNKNSILKFQPKTEVGKQLLEEIKRHHNQQDQIGIKKCIVNFISRYRENLQKQMKEKVALPQRLSKLHIEDSKQLLLFCPVKKQGVQTEMPLNNETEQFLDILKQISQGHLMQYWRLLQEKKL